jgi:dUTPase
MLIEDCVVNPLERAIVNTGLCVEITPESGTTGRMALDLDLPQSEVSDVLAGVDRIRSFRGELKVVLSGFG